MSIAELVKQTDISFYHGLGDIANFARLIPVYKKYGIDIGVKSDLNKEFCIQAAGGRVLTSEPKEHHKWPIQHGKLDQNPGNDRGWDGNKTGSNMHHFGLGDKANHEQLWADLKSVDVQCKHLISLDDWNIVEGITDNWPKPIVLWHSIGNTNRQQKSFNEKQQFDFGYELLDRFDGTLLLLDWDSRVKWTRHHRLKHLMPEFGTINLSRLAALMYRSDLMIGIDSGPFYFSALTDIPSVGVYFDNIHPSEYMIPLKRTLTLTMGGRSQTLDRAKRFEFQIVDTIGMDGCAEWCSRMLKSRRYLPNTCEIAADVQLQQIVQKKLRGQSMASNALSTIYDRHRSFDILFVEALKRWPTTKDPIFIVETGCIRSAEDWGGAGFSTAIFGRYAQQRNGLLVSFDLDENNCNYARNWCRQFGSHVNIRCGRGEDGLRSIDKSIDILYLDSLDSDHAGHQEENLKEFKAAEKKLHEKSIVCIDDTPAIGVGKGGLTVRYMLDNDWRILYAGYQVVLVRKYDTI